MRVDLSQTLPAKPIGTRRRVTVIGYDFIGAPSLTDMTGQHTLGLYGGAALVVPSTTTPSYIGSPRYFADYYPFGWKQPGRSFNDVTLNYRYGYQGQENDPETRWDAFELRMWDGRIARWMTIDPKKQYASPYLGMGNNPIIGIDFDGGWSDQPSGGGWFSRLRNGISNVWSAIKATFRWNNAVSEAAVAQGLWEDSGYRDAEGNVELAAVRSAPEVIVASYISRVGPNPDVSAGVRVSLGSLRGGGFARYQLSGAYPTFTGGLELGMGLNTNDIISGRVLNLAPQFSPFFKFGFSQNAPTPGGSVTAQTTIAGQADAMSSGAYFRTTTNENGGLRTSFGLQVNPRPSVRGSISTTTSWQAKYTAQIMR